MSDLTPFYGLQDQKDRLKGEENRLQDGQEDGRASSIGCRIGRIGYRKGRKMVEQAAWASGPG